MAAENAAAMGRSVTPMKLQPNQAAEVPRMRVAAQAAARAEFAAQNPLEENQEGHRQ